MVVPERPERQKDHLGEASQGSGKMRPDDRQRMIAEAAYFRAERRGFRGNEELDDWLAAEAQVDSGSAEKRDQ